MKIDLSEIRRGAFEELEKSSELVNIPGSGASVNFASRNAPIGRDLYHYHPVDDLRDFKNLISPGGNGVENKTLPIPHDNAQIKPFESKIVSSGNLPIDPDKSTRNAEVTLPAQTISPNPSVPQPEIPSASATGTVGKALIKGLGVQEKIDNYFGDSTMRGIKNNKEYQELMKKYESLKPALDFFNKVPANIKDNLLQGKFMDFFNGAGGTIIPAGIGGLLLASLMSSNKKRSDNDRAQNITVNVGGAGRPDLFNNTGVRSFSNMKEGEFKPTEAPLWKGTAFEGSKLYNALFPSQGTFNLPSQKDLDVLPPSLFPFAGRESAEIAGALDPSQITPKLTPLAGNLTIDGSVPGEKVLDNIKIPQRAVGMDIIDAAREGVSPLTMSTGSSGISPETHKAVSTSEGLWDAKKIMLFL